MFSTTVHSTFQFVVTRGAAACKRLVRSRFLRGVVLIRRATLLLFCCGLFWPSLAFNQTPRSTGAEKPGKAYWEQLHAREQHLAESLRRAEPSGDQLKAVASEIAQAGAAIQPALIEAKDGPAKPVVPSLYQRHPDQFRVGVAVAFVLALVIPAMIRHRRAEEIRELSGGYLSDGTEVAKFKMPEWFAPQLTSKPQPVANLDLIDVTKVETALPAALVEFFEQAPQRLAKIVETLKELKNDALPIEDRQKALLKAHELVCVLRDKADDWHLRPAWQMSSTLEMLIKMLVDKPKYFSPSVVRSMASALDVLGEVCVPGIRPNLLVDPPPRILAVDDDPLCRRALKFALEKANLLPDLAESGERAVELATAQSYDMVFMDIQMPGIDGLTACVQIQETKRNSGVPVVFVTSQSDFNTRAQVRLKGGSDLMGKPFVVFEVAVRAITFTMRRRLQAAGIHCVEEQPMTAAVPGLPKPTTEPPVADAKQQVIPSNTGELTGDFLKEIHDFLATTWKLVEELPAPGAATELQEPLGAIYLRLHTLATQAGQAKLPVATQVAAALEALLKRLHRNPKILSASVLSTIRNALKLLESLCVPGMEQKLAQHPPVRILVADDEPLARRAVVGALQLAFGQPDSAQDGTEASTLAEKTSYDVVFTDIQMPGLDGFELCRAIRASTLNASTPVVFITNSTDVEAQAKATATGGSDFIGKPFLPVEITVKALTFAWEGRLQKTLSTAVSLPAPEKNSEPAAPLQKRVEVVPAMPVTPILQTADATASETASTSKQLIPINTGELNGDFLTEIPKFLAATREIVEDVQSPSGGSDLQEQLGALYLRVHTIATQAEQARLPIAAHVASTLEALLKRLHRNSNIVTASTLNTVLKALRLLESVCRPGLEQRLAQHPPVRILVVEDEPLARRAVVGALQLAFEKPEGASNGTKAAAMVAKESYDVIFTDIQMPGLDGFELCAAIRDGTLNASTPVVFITNSTDVEAQAKAAASGGNDFISKPFLPIEITVKALTFAWEGRLKKLPSAPEKTVEPMPALIAA